VKYMFLVYSDERAWTDSEREHCFQKSTSYETAPDVQGRNVMLLKLNETPRIEDLRNHSAESIKTLRTLLQTGAHARRDPRRRDFYEVDNCSRVFYIHITPRGKVWLLAIWAKDSAESGAEPAGSVATMHASREATTSSSTLMSRGHMSC
jgi:hypothetical protein